MVEIHIQKVRYSWLGKVGMVEFGYDTVRRQYTYGSLVEMQPKAIPFNTRNPSEPNTPTPDNPSAGICKHHQVSANDTEFWKDP